MKRIPISPREDWQSKVESVGLTFHTDSDIPYWDETAYYAFSMRQIEEIERATEELYQMCLVVAENVIKHGRYRELAIPAAAIPAIEHSWNESKPSLYGRFDLVYDGCAPPKLLEFNADTPTSLLEAAVVQWYWLQEVFPTLDQFNSIHEKLIAQWNAIKPHLFGTSLHFGYVDTPEDLMTVAYLQDTAQQAGISTLRILMEEIGWNEHYPHFRDLDDNGIHSIFKLYPWEWLIQEQEKKVLAEAQRVVWIEPMWRMIWSNKALLPLLWEAFPNHPNLLPAYLESPRDLKNYVRKPFFSREGANIEIHRNGELITSRGPYTGSSVVYQGLAEVPCFEGNYPVLGSWYVTDQGPAGVGIRESTSRITDNMSRFLCHLIT